MTMIRQLIFVIIVNVLIVQMETCVHLSITSQITNNILLNTSSECKTMKMNYSYHEGEILLLECSKEFTDLYSNSYLTLNGTIELNENSISRNMTLHQMDNNTTIECALKKFHNKNLSLANQQSELGQVQVILLMKVTNKTLNTYPITKPNSLMVPTSTVNSSFRDNKAFITIPRFTSTTHSTTLKTLTVLPHKIATSLRSVKELKHNNISSDSTTSPNKIILSMSPTTSFMSTHSTISQTVTAPVVPTTVLPNSILLVHPSNTFNWTSLTTSPNISGLETFKVVPSVIPSSIQPVEKPSYDNFTSSSILWNKAQTDYPISTTSASPASIHGKTLVQVPHTASGIETVPIEIQMANSSSIRNRTSNEFFTITIPSISSTTLEKQTTLLSITNLSLPDEKNHFYFDIRTSNVDLTTPPTTPSTRLQNSTTILPIPTTITKFPSRLSDTMSPPSFATLTTNPVMSSNMTIVQTETIYKTTPKGRISVPSINLIFNIDSINLSSNYQSTTKNSTSTNNIANTTSSVHLITSSSLLTTTPIINLNTSLTSTLAAKSEEFPTTSASSFSSSLTASVHSSPTTINTVFTSYTIKSFNTSLSIATSTVTAANKYEKKELKDQVALLIVGIMMFIILTSSFIIIYMKVKENKQKRIPKKYLNTIDPEIPAYPPQWNTEYYTTIHNQKDHSNITIIHDQLYTKPFSKSQKNKEKDKSMYTKQNISKKKRENLVLQELQMDVIYGNTSNNHSQSDSDWIYANQEISNNKHCKNVYAQIKPKHKRNQATYVNIPNPMNTTSSIQPTYSDLYNI